MRAAKALSSLLHEVSHEQHIAPEAAVKALHAKVWRADEVAASATTRATMPTGFVALDAEFPGAGWPRGQLIELLVERAGTGELSLLAPALVQTSRERRPCVFWAIEQSLRTAHLGALICWLPASSSVDAEFRALRRLHLLASQTRTLLFALRGSHCLSAPSPAALRLQLEPRDGQLQVHILKRRGRPLLEPVAVQIHPAHWHTARVHGVPSTQTHVQVPPATASASAAQRVSQPQRWSWQALFAH